jgi:CubicO group peptidase (beta-lactamase class C family)
MSRPDALRLLVLLLVLVPLFAVVDPTRAQDAATPAGAEGAYRDPAGRFTLPVPPNWTVEEHDGYVLLRAPDGDLSFAALVVAADDAGAGVIAAWRVVDPTFDPAAREPDRAEIPSDPGVDQTVVLTYELGGPTGRVAQAVGQRVGDQVYVFIVRGDFDTAVRHQEQINVILTGSRILAVALPDLVGRAPLPLEGDRLTTFEAFVADTLAAFGVPGAAVAVVQGGRIVYAQGFGVAEQGTDRPVTPDTLMMVGSVTKSFTTMLMATLVDDGLLAWDEPVVQILPTFALADPAITPMVTVRHLVCACSGVPRRDHELAFNADDLTAEDVIASLADVPLAAPLGEAYLYNNQMVAVGGYVAALAAGGEGGDLGTAYAAAVQERVLDPIGMPRSCFDPGVVAADADHALPHGATLDGGFAPMPLASEAREVLIAPASGLWSSANEMALYLLTELGRGVGPAGNRVVSAENQGETWEPQVAVTADLSYALGWYVETWRGLDVVRHGGNTSGFTSDVAFLPDADLGVVVLTNAQRANDVARGIRQRLLELLFDQPSQVDPQIAAVLEAARQQQAQAEARFGNPIDPALARTLTGDYRNDALGPVRITYEAGVLVADAGEFRAALRPLRDSPPEGPAFVAADPPFAGFPVRFDTTGPTPRLVVGAPPGQVAEVEGEYIFDLIGAGATPVPSPAA